MICASRRHARNWLASSASRSRPWKRMRPLSGSINRSTSRLTVDLPHPDSPTSASVLPASTLQLTPSTALTNAVARPNTERRATKCFTRSRTSSRAVTFYPPQRDSYRVPGAAVRCRTGTHLARNKIWAPVQRCTTALGLCCTAPGEWRAPPSRHQPLERRLDAARPVRGAYHYHRRRRVVANFAHKGTTGGEAAAGRRRAHVRNHALDGGEMRSAAV